MGGYWWLVLIGVGLAFLFVIPAPQRWRAKPPDASRPSPPAPKPASPPAEQQLFSKIITIDADKAFRQREEALRHPVRRQDPIEEARFVISARLETYDVHDEPPPPMPKPGTVDGAAFEISYADADGVVTERVIRVKEVTGENGFAYIRAYCYLARADRTFRSDRILSLKDHRTGASIRDPVKFFSIFYDAEDEIVVSHEAVMSRARPGLLALIWVARADNEFDEAAVDLLLDFVDARRSIGKNASDLQWNRDVARRWILSNKPTFDNAAGALARMAKAGRAATLIREYIDRLGATSPARGKRAARMLR